MKNLGLYVFIGIILLLGVWIFSSYNGLVNKEADVQNAWAKVQSAYQERADLIPNLVSTVQGAADFEKGTLTDIIEARSKAFEMKVDASNLTPETLAEFQKVQGNVGGALGRLMAVVESYPTLRATENFTMLQSQLEGIENRIRVERNRFNETATEYNKTVRRIPGNFIAGIFGFEQKGLFEADAGADKAPKVKFDK